MTNEELLNTLVTMGAKAHAYDQIAHIQTIAAKDAEIATMRADLIAAKESHLAALQAALETPAK